jgi:hypothetical protein
VRSHIYPVDPGDANRMLIGNPRSGTRQGSGSTTTRSGAAAGMRRGRRTETPHSRVPGCRSRDQPGPYAQRSSSRNPVRVEADVARYRESKFPQISWCEREDSNLHALSGTGT